MTTDIDASASRLVRERISGLANAAEPTDEVWNAILQLEGDTSPHRPTRLTGRRRVALAATGSAALLALVAFGFADNGPGRPGLDRYNPRAITAVDGDLPLEDSQVVVVMEVRNVCRQVHLFATGGKTLNEATASIDDSTRTALAHGKRVNRAVDITEFSNFAQAEIKDAQISGTTQPLRDFLDGECPNQDFSIPILAGDS